MLRGLLEAAIARTVTPLTPAAPPATDGVTVIRRGFAYRCRRCDVYGYVGPDDEQVCWSCEDAGALERR